MVTKKELAEMVEHTNLSMDATEEDIKKLCQEAIDCGFGGVCVRSNMVDTASSYLIDHNVKNLGSIIDVVSVIGFPTKKCRTMGEMVKELSSYSKNDKKEEAKYAMDNGAGHIDMVIDLGAMKRGEYNVVEDDIKAIVREAEKKSVFVKTILENCYLISTEKALACKIAECAGADYVKTSTGYGVSGATADDIELMSRTVSESIGIKAAGGIYTLEKALQLYEASQKYRRHDFRIGASKLVNEYKK